MTVRPVPGQLVDQYLAAGRAALAEVGGDTDALGRDGGSLYWRTDLIGGETAWRAHVIASDAIGKQPRCAECFRRQHVDCDADGLFVTDCGRDQ